MKWFRDLPIVRKQMLMLMGVALLPILILGLLSYSTAKQELSHSATEALIAVRDLKTAAINRHFDQLRGQITSMALSEDVQIALVELTQGFNSLNSGTPPNSSGLAAYYQSQFAAEYQKRSQKAIATQPILAALSPAGLWLQTEYIANNANPLGSKHLLNSGADETPYNRTHAKLHPKLRHELEAFGYYDIFIVDNASGNVVYTVFKELDFATNLTTGSWAKTDLARAFGQAKTLPQGKTSLTDFAPYIPSYEAPAAFLATPIYIQGKALGTLIVQVPIEPINAIMQERSGMGKTGETYLVGPDYLMRSDSFLDPTHHSVSASFAAPETGSVKTEAIKKALSGQTSAELLIDYNGNPVLSAFAPLKIADFSWVIAAEIDQAEALKSVYSLRTLTLIIGVILLAAVAVLALFSARMVSQPITSMEHIISRVQKEGNFRLSLNNRDQDEIGKTCRSVDKLVLDTGRVIQLVNLHLQQLVRGETVNAITEVFPGDLGLLAQGVNSTVEAIDSARKEQARQAVIIAQKAQEAEQAAQEARHQATQTLIIKQALDVCATAAMIADTHHKIVYTNQALEHLMQHMDGALRTEVGSVKAGHLNGIELNRFAHLPNLANTQQQSQTQKNRWHLGHFTLDTAVTPIRGPQGEYLGCVVEWIDRTEELAKHAQETKIAQENARIRQALDASSTSTLILDEQQLIIYANRAMQTLLTASQRAIASQIPHFNAAAIMGKSSDYVHPHRQLQAAALKNNLQTVQIDNAIGDKHFVITASPITDNQQQQLGTVIEWRDRSAEIAIEKEINQVIQTASKGDFSALLNLQGKSGFFLNVAQGLNQIITTTKHATDEIIRVIGAMALGDLTQRISSDYSGEFALVKRDVNKTLDSLTHTMSEIILASETIATSSQQISAGTQDLSTRTEEQASSLEETAASMEEITQMLHKSQHNAETANSLSLQAVEIAKSGDASVEKTAAAMRGIQAASTAIANIIGVIDELAFQTNLLALNAAVEAARAGEQGRGFAVVAAEVRSLAQRSAHSAKEIKQLIQDSVSRVQDGSALVEVSRKTLNQMVQEILQVANMVGEIVVTTKEQASGVSQINTAILQMDQITQQNAALVEQASAASETMADQARALDQLMGFFKR
ncbi:MAG TPA: methyl-accepting chemotaxis protein [Cellvibrionaceae bacterium]|nr:methyl-accepting chemotaxis protein [Cellvibrionaceae bacterium]HMY37766.1 methyl-accepting chemotaxis protein [Marinagarivorans sp.]